MHSYYIMYSASFWHLPGSFFLLLPLASPHLLLSLSSLSFFFLLPFSLFSVSFFPLFSLLPYLFFRACLLSLFLSTCLDEILYDNCKYDDFIKCCFIFFVLFAFSCIKMTVERQYDKNGKSNPFKYFVNNMSIRSDAVMYHSFELALYSPSSAPLLSHQNES